MTAMTVAMWNKEERKKDQQITGGKRGEIKQTMTDLAADPHRGRTANDSAEKQGIHAR